MEMLRYGQQIDLQDEAGKQVVFSCYSNCIGLFAQFFSAGLSVDELHQQYAKQGRINEQALTKSKASLVVNAPIAKVWELLIRPDKWYLFYPSFRSVKFTALSHVD